MKIAKSKLPAPIHWCEGKYLIIGNSTAAVSAIEAIRKVDRTNTITVVSDEPYHVYSRPLISYLLGGKVESTQMNYRDKDFYKIYDIQTVLGKKVCKIDTKRKTVILTDKTVLGYEKLLIASGGRPVIPEIQGVKSKGVFTFTKLGDVEKIEEYTKKNRIKRVVILGAGLIGLKAAEAMLSLGVKLAIVELADRILSTTFDNKASKIIQDALLKEGCGVFLNNTIVEIKTKNNKVSQVLLKDKTRIAAKMVILAIGVRPNTEFLAGSNIRVNRGIVVDRNMRSNIEDIWAAGDVTEADSLIDDVKRVIAILPVAYQQGSIAGSNMAGLGKTYMGGLQMNAVELCGIPTISVGMTTKVEGCEILESCELEESRYKKIILRDNRLIGFILVGAIERAGILTGLIQNKMDVGRFKDELLKDDFGFISLPAEYRKHMVGGEGIEI